MGPLNSLIRWLGKAYRRHEYRYHVYEERGYRTFVFLVGVALVLLVIGTAIGLLRAGYRIQQAGTFLVKAEDYLARGDYQNASLYANETLEFNSKNESACRVLAEVAAFTHSTMEVKWRQKLVDLTPSVENKLNLAAAGLRCQNAPFPLTAQILGELAATATNNIRYQELAAELAENLQDSDGVEFHYAAALKLAPTNQQFALKLALFRLGSTNAERKSLAREQLEKLSGEASLAPEALRALMADRMAAEDVVAADLYYSRLLATQQATVADRLQNLGVLRRRKSADFEIHMLSLESEAATNANSVAAVSHWMQANGLVKENLGWLFELPDSIRTQQPVEQAIAQAYLENGEWQSLLDFCGGAYWGDVDYLRLAMISHAWSQLGVASVAESKWAEAMNRAWDRYEAMTNLLGLAQHWQLKYEKQDLRLQIGRKFPGKPIPGDR